MRQLRGDSERRWDVGRDNCAEGLDMIDVIITVNIVRGRPKALRGTVERPP